MKSMVEGECGGANPLVGLAQGYGTSNSRIAPGVSRGISSLLPSSSRGEQMAADFLAEQSAKTAVPMSFDMNALSRQLPTPSGASAALASQWSKDFHPSRSGQLANQWSRQFTPSPAGQMEAAWRQATGTPPLMAQQMPMSSGLMQSLNGPQSSTSPGMWSAEFLDKFDTDTTTTRMADEWTREFSGNHEEELWRKLEGEWAKQREEFIRNGWEQEEASHAEYLHQSANPFMSELDSLRIGDEAMRGGDLEKAILAYEAAVQNNPQDAEAWCRLGLSHAENEHDDKAIQAFRKALEIDPRNEEALLSLSVSLANECLENDALMQLERWLAAHTGADPSAVQRLKPSFTSFLDHQDFDRVERLFLSAAGRQASADASLQNALGVLYNLGRTFDRAVDSLKLAISSQPQDPRLWNRLGATLANGDRTPEAISAYREALRLYPGYVRARYNLGISCMHLSSYREAVSHFVSALELQKGPKESSSIWQPLRSSAIRCLEHSSTLLPLIDAKDLAGLKRAVGTLPPMPFE